MIDLFISQPILEELEEVLKISRFKYPHEITETVVMEFAALLKIVVPIVRLKVVEKNRDNDRILRNDYSMIAFILI